MVPSQFLSAGSLDDFRRQIDRMFYDFASPRWRTLAPVRRTLGAVSEDDEAWTLQVSLPGVTAKDVALEVTNKHLTISAKRELETPEGYEIRRRERAPLSFSRTISFANDVDPETATATFTDGVLTVRVAKAAAAKVRHIEIKELA